MLNLASKQPRRLTPPVYGQMASWSAAPAIPAPTPTPEPTATPVPTALPTPVPNQAPLVRIGTPTSGALGRAVGEIRGLLFDDTLGERLALRVTLRLANGPYWNGRALQDQPFPLATTQFLLPTSPYGSMWRVSTPLPTPAQLRDGFYLVEAVATDRERLTSRSAAGVRVDLTPPQIALTTVNFNNVRSVLSGTWRDGGRVQAVYVQIRRPNNTFWNGLRWQATPVLLPLLLSNMNRTATEGQFSLTTGLPPLRNLPLGSFITVLAVDRAGNRSSIRRAVGLSAPAA